MLVKYRAALVVFFLVLTNLAQAQVSGTTSPYSRYGIGDLQSVDFVRMSAMGGASIAVREDTLPGQISNFAPSFVNFNNPASYSGLLFTAFDLGAKSQFVQLKDNTATENKSNVSFSYFSLGFPIKKLRGGAAFGMRKYSQIGYDLSETKYLTNIGNVNYQYIGEGGLNQFYVGMGYSLCRKRGHDLSLGFNVSYLFGALSNIRKIEPDSTITALNLRYTQTTNLGDVHFDWGLQYRKLLANDVFIGLGFTHSLNEKIKGSLTSVGERYFVNAIGVESYQDTAFYNKTSGGTVTLPQALGFGLSIQKGTKWLFAADYKMQDWSKYEAFGETDNLANSWRGSAGFEFSPDRFATPRPARNFFKRTAYRLGGYYSSTYLQLNSTQLNDYGVTFGFGLPLPLAFGASSNLNIAVDLGQRGTLASNLIKESYANIRFGLILNDRWFIQRKYD